MEDKCNKKRVDKMEKIILKQIEDLEALKKESTSSGLKLTIVGAINELIKSYIELLFF